MNSTLRQNADDAVCRFFYDGAIAHSKCERRTFKDAVKAIVAAGPGYKFRGKHYMNCDGLQREKKRLQRSANKLREEVGKHTNTQSCYAGLTLKSVCVCVLLLTGDAGPWMHGRGRR